jgi:crotonobetaine/carnitine-CoA ligase
VPPDRIWLTGEQDTVTALLDARLETDPDGEYLDVCGTTFSAAQVNDTANRIANGLRTLGVQPGERAPVSRTAMRLGGVAPGDAR